MGMNPQAQRIDESWERIKPKSWGKGTHRRKREALYDLLEYDELPECMIAGVFTTDRSASGDSIYIDGVVVATEKRLLAVDRGMLGKEQVHQIDYKDIRDIVYESKSVRISGPTLGTYKIGNIFEDDVEKPFINYVLGRIGGGTLGEGEQAITSPTGMGMAGRAPRVDRIDAAWDRIKPDSWDDKTHWRKREALYDLLDNDELPECMIAGVFESKESSLGDDGIYIDGVVVGTNQRVLAVDRGMLGTEDVSQIDYKDIRDIRLESETVQITCLHRTYQIGTVYENGVEEPFVNYVLARMGRTPLTDNQHFIAAQEAGFAHAHSTQQAMPPMSVADELEKLAGLVEKGFLTQSEFDARKDQLLGVVPARGPVEGVTESPQTIAVPETARAQHSLEHAPASRDDASKAQSERQRLLDRRWNELKPMSWSENDHQENREALYDLLGRDESLEGLIAGTFRLERREAGAPVVDGIVAATDKRLLGVEKRYGTEKVIQVEYKDIGEVTHRPGVTGASIRISGPTMKTYEIRYIQGDSESFANLVQSHPDTAAT